MDAAPPERPWWLYVLISSASGRTYVGITVDLVGRLAAHNGDRPGGAQATRAHRPWQIGAVYGPYPDRSLASRAEALLKRRRGPARLTWGPLDDPRWRPPAPW